ncbi:MAG: hypothetical protein ACLQNE_20335 [Thermoguttaceae bacterium]
MEEPQSVEAFLASLEEDTDAARRKAAVAFAALAEKIVRENARPARNEIERVLKAANKSLTDLQTAIDRVRNLVDLETEVAKLPAAEEECERARNEFEAYSAGSTARREAYQESQRLLGELNGVYETAQNRVSAIRAAKQRLNGMQEHEAK